MLLNLQRYNIDLQFVTGKDNVVADALSRAPSLSTTGSKYSSKVSIFRVFGDVENIRLSSYLSVSDERINEIIEMTAEDRVLQTVLLYIRQGWPDKIDHVPMEAKPFYKYRNELSTQDGLVFRNDRIVIPSSLYRSVADKLHVGHTGIESTLKLARENVFWPGMSNQIKHLIQDCSVCAKFSSSQQHPPMKSHAVPIYPFQLISMDAFFVWYKGKQRKYLIMVDHYSDYFELDLLKDMTPNSVIDVCKRHFSRHGTPQLLVTDNGSNFVNEQMKCFAKSWGFKHSTSAPHHQQANGKAESAVKIAKQLLKKSEESGQDFWITLQHWRNTPNKIGSSPSSRLLSRNIRCGIPMPVTNLIPKVVELVPESILNNRRKIKYNYDKRSRNLPEIAVGSPVYVQLRPDTSKLWTPGVVSDRLSDRSYLIDVEGAKYRRDAVNVKSRKEPTAPLIPKPFNSEGHPERCQQTTPQPPIRVIPQDTLQSTVNNNEDIESFPPSHVALKIPTRPLHQESPASPGSSKVPDSRSPDLKVSTPRTDRPIRESRLPRRYRDFVVFK